MTDGVMLKSNSHEAAAFPQADDGDVPWMARGAYEMVAGESVPRIAPRPAVAVGVQVAGAVAVDGGGGASIVLRPSPTPLSRVPAFSPSHAFQTSNRKPE